MIITGIDNCGQPFFTGEDMRLRITFIPKKNRKSAPPEGSWLSFRQKMKNGKTQRGPEMWLGRKAWFKIDELMSIISTIGDHLDDMEGLKEYSHGVDCSGQQFFNVSNIRVTVTNGKSSGHPGKLFLGFREYVGDKRTLHRGPETPIWTAEHVQEIVDILNIISICQLG